MYKNIFLHVFTFIVLTYRVGRDITDSFYVIILGYPRDVKIFILELPKIEKKNLNREKG